jgi:hypothetical protein
MICKIDIVNPKTNEELHIVLSLTEEQYALVQESDEHWLKSIVALARPLMPEGFMTLGGRISPLN